jgi:site-specific recombinase XerD
VAPADDLLLSRVEDFLAGLQAAKRSVHTIDAYRDDLIGVATRIAVALHGPDARVADLRVAELEGRVMRHAFAAWASDHAAASILRAWGTFSRFFEYLIDDEALDRNPMKTVPKPKLAVTAPRAIRHENVAAILLAAAATEDPNARRSKRWPERDVALIAVYCVTGIRLTEAITLRLDSISGPAGAQRLQVTGKGKKDRWIPIAPGLEAVIERYLKTRQARHGDDALNDPTAPLLVHYDNTELTRGRVQYVIEQIYRRAGLRAAVPPGALVHALRHSFASLAIESGTDVAELRELLGHASLATTSRYLDAHANRLRQAVTAHPSQRALDDHG